MSLMEQARQKGKDTATTEQQSAVASREKRERENIEFVTRATGIDPVFIGWEDISRFVPGHNGSVQVAPRSDREEVMQLAVFTIDDVQIAVCNGWPSENGSGKRLVLVGECVECHRKMVDRLGLDPKKVPLSSPIEWQIPDPTVVVETIAKALRRLGNQCTFCKAACPERCVTCGQDWVR